ncbi:MAG: tRNA preQ1(34) S-adenosylmethionine ribosyltransferase-isomerase QueA [Clostridia bacterium]|nr:tRNA preQ1(34) S-adenosylmethionine ribosyltransferase-isomerase QueA [Clostridia bacterium]
MEQLLKSDFYFDLPEELIAQDPLVDRASSRLLVMDKVTGEIKHKVFSDILDYLREGDCLVINDTKVIPARIIGEKINELQVSKKAVASTEITEEEDSHNVTAQRGAKVELLLLKRVGEDLWETLVKPGKKARPGMKISFGDGKLVAEILEVVEEGNRLVKFHYDGIFEEVLDELGTMPLPPYITHELQDKNRYQTVYAKYDGSAAAPTAGLHFTNELLEKVKEKGVKIAHVTLHVGLGTFRPVKEENVLNHHMHTEHYRMRKEDADLINETKAAGGRVICVGTTSTRTVESCATEDGRVCAGEGDTSIFIYPGYKFKVLDGLITNFHLPESTLIMLVSALCGRENTLNAYEVAVKERYRFFSFGDACLFI